VGLAVNNFVSFTLGFKSSAGVEERRRRGTELLWDEEDVICGTAWVANYGGFIYRKFPKSASSVCCPVLVVSIASGLREAAACFHMREKSAINLREGSVAKRKL